MGKERDPHIVYSQASLPPHISIVSGSERLGQVVKEAGAEGLEVLPMWGIWWEACLRGWLLDVNSVESFHQTWKVDTLLEGRQGIKTRPFDKVIRSLAFPPKRWTDLVMRQLWNYYERDRIPTVIHAVTPETTLGKEDKYSFYLELAHQNAKNLPELLTWVGKKPEIRGIVFPSRDDQLNGWSERYAPTYLNKSWGQVAEELIGHIKSIHLGPLTTTELKVLMKKDEGQTEVEERLVSLYQYGFRGSAVIEVNPLEIPRVSQSLGLKPFQGFQAVAARFKDLRDKYAP